MAQTVTVAKLEGGGQKVLGCSVYLNPMTTSSRYIKINNRIISVNSELSVKKDEIQMSGALREIFATQIGQTITYSNSPQSEIIDAKSVTMDVRIKKITDDHKSTILTKGDIIDALKKFAGIILCKNFPYYLRIDDISLEVHTLSLNHDNVKLTTETEIIINKVKIHSDSIATLLITDRTSSLVNNWDIQSLGVGGLSNQFQDLFRRVFVSRTYHPKFIQEIELKHVRGMILYGPPGTGKTLLARQISKILNCAEPKIVNGPQILNKYVGESEGLTRELFKEAEEEYKKLGDHSKLHVIIFDEIDSLFKKRGSLSDSTGVNSNVVNTLLTKMDGYSQLNNILVIGMTNRLDLLDEALLRPGRFEVVIEIALPDEAGRFEILEIHTKKYKDKKLLADNVNLKTLASQTKNFTGAELSGLVKSATSFAMDSTVEKKKSGDKYSCKTSDKFLITHDHFQQALEEIKPKYGTNEILEKLLPENIIYYSNNKYGIKDLITWIQKDTNQLLNNDYIHKKVYLICGDSGTGKTTFSAILAKELNLSFSGYINNMNYIGKDTMSKCSLLKESYMEAMKSKESLLIIDNIETLLELTENETTGNYSFSTQVYNTLATLLSWNNTNKLIIVITGQSIETFKKLKIASYADHHFNLPKMVVSDDKSITIREHLMNSVKVHD